MLGRHGRCCGCWRWSRYFDLAKIFEKYVFGRMKDWLLTGAIDDNPRLECDLAGPGYTLTSKTQILLESKVEMKDRGVDSPDDADALALTFARKVVAPVKESRPLPLPRIGIWG